MAKMRTNRYDEDEPAGFERIRTFPEIRKAEKKKPVKPQRTYEEIEKAVWQYLVDHSTPHPKGYAISFVMQSKQDFFRRVEARRTGAFKRYEEEVIANDVRKVQKADLYRQRRAQAYQEARKNGSLLLRIALYFHAALKRFIDKRV